jgi:hypothetical protein
MSEPLSLPDDLGVYLGRDDINLDRALLLLQLAHDRLEQIVAPVPVPPAARGIELSVAARAYSNVTSAQQMGIGSAQVSFGAANSSSGVGGLYVSKSERADLRRLAGLTGGAFTIDLLPGA